MGVEQTAFEQTAIEQISELPHSASRRTRLFDEFGFLRFGRGCRRFRLEGEAELVGILLGVNPDGPAFRELAEQQLFGQLRDGGRVEVDVADSGLTFRYAPLKAPPETVGTE